MTHTPGKLLKREKLWKSIILWPDTVSTGNTPNETVDWHYTKAAAEHVCRTIEREGMGLLRKVFPVSTRVEEDAN